MQVSRSLRCLYGNGPLRTLQLFRYFDDISRHTSQKCYQQQQHIAPFVSYFKALYSSGPGSKSTESIQPSTSAVQDDFNITELQAQPAKTKTKIYKMLTVWYIDLQNNLSTKETGEKVDNSEIWTKTIQPRLQSAIRESLTDDAPPDMKIKCLAILLHFDRTSPFISKILNHTIRDIQFMPMKCVPDIVNLLSVSGQGIDDVCHEARKKLVFEIINNRWFEIGSKHILFFLYQLDVLLEMKEICLKSRLSGGSGDNLSRNETRRRHDSGIEKGKVTKEDLSIPPEVNILNVEKRLIGLADQMKPKDLARVVSLMGKWRNRNGVLLRSLVHRLSLADMEDFSLFHVTNLLYACSVLNLHNASLLEKLCQELMNRDFSPSPTCVFLVMTSLSHLKWHDSDLVSKCLSYLSISIKDNGIESVSLKDSWNVLKSLGTLYALPQTEDETTVIKYLAHSLFTKTKYSVQKVETALCLAILGLLDGHTAKTVLEPSFVQEFVDENDPQKKIALQKLRAISLSAKFELEGYDGPYIEEDLLNMESNTGRSAKELLLLESLLQALSKFVDMDSYVKRSQSIPGGLHADAVMCTSADGNLKPLTRLENSDNGMLRLSIQVIPFSGVLAAHDNQTRYSGIHQLESRHLRHLGYVPVQIPYLELRKSQSVFEHVNSIQVRIKKAVSDIRFNSSSDTTTSSSSSSATSSASSSTEV